MRKIWKYTIGLFIFITCILSFLHINIPHIGHIKISHADSLRMDSLRRFRLLETELAKRKVRGRKYFLCGAVHVGPIKVPDSMLFCGEPIPLADTAVKNALQLFINYNVPWAGQKCYLQQINRDIMPLVLPVIKKFNLPEDLVFMAFTESNLQNVTSPTGAGIWQLNINTARDMGLEVDSFVDERYDMIKCTEAACRYLSYLHGELGSWLKVLPAYNMGDGAFFNVWGSLDQQTSSDLLLHNLVAPYAFKIFAFKTILTNKQCEGLKEDKSAHHHVISVTTEITDLEAFAKLHGITLTQLKENNPWLLTNTLPNPTHHSYNVYID